MKRVILESPFAGEVERNRAYLQQCIRDALKRGESPYASHQMLTAALDDGDPSQRELGIKAGSVWREAADSTVIYVDHGLSSGMRRGIQDAMSLSHPMEFRALHGDLTEIIGRIAKEVFEP